MEGPLGDGALVAPRLVEIPTLYGGEFGPDLGDVAEHNGISDAEVIKIHSGADYLVYMMGFLPGFPYLGGMSERIATPRLKTPRSAIPAGSVAIAERQTGIYPVESPGGWRIIGRTPISLFDPSREPPVEIEPGDYLRFVQVDESEYADVQSRIWSGTYTLVTRQRGESS
jgi:KipI family sensor histidine kinase inhibitor